MAGEKPPGEKPRNPGWNNLRPPKPGEVRNPKGRNGQPWVKGFYDFFGRGEAFDITDVKAAKEEARAPRDVVRMQNVWEATYRKAITGSEQAQKLIIEQMQGRASQSVHVSGGGNFGGPGGHVVMVLPDDGSGEDLWEPSADEALLPGEEEVEPGEPKPDDEGE